ncbi:ComF family protein [Gracilibacillus sp. S3-1-1]|uniref:ComF family protein n=1 Tax=Gracilibacillus pellucidus TaxID=3095368 RepID=A0ACC6M0W8_9BACI|nr:ComF family protein [Gracilibacillus sp. S3-1-1]MDX8044593.1 ComF family protein [Gracilibacillus sp. S3-1-1]
MSKCLKCQAEIEQQVTWSTFLLPPEPANLCDDCESQLSVIQAPICRRCGKPHTEGELCGDCKGWKDDDIHCEVLACNRSLFTYSAFIQAIIAQWKYRGDYQLKEIFFPFIKSSLQSFYPLKELTIVPIPLSEERLYERGFNQALAIAEIVAENYHIPIEQVLSRKENHGEKQSKKSRNQRLAAKNPFFLSKTLETNVLIVDDIYTTGMTIHHAARLLKEAGCPSVYSFTLVR